MLTLVFGNKSKEDALAMRDLFCSSVKGIPGYIENEILITSQLTKSDGTMFEDGESEYNVCGKDYKHVVMVCLSSDNQSDGTPEFDFGIKFSTLTNIFSVSILILLLNIILIGFNIFKCWSFDIKFFRY